MLAYVVNAVDLLKLLANLILTSCTYRSIAKQQTWWDWPDDGWSEVNVWRPSNTHFINFGHVQTHADSFTLTSHRHSISDIL